MIWFALRRPSPRLRVADLLTIPPDDVVDLRPVPLAGIVARVSLEIGGGNRRLECPSPPGGRGPRPSAILGRSPDPGPFGVRWSSVRLSHSAREQLPRLVCRLPSPSATPARPASRERAPPPSA